MESGSYNIHWRPYLDSSESDSDVSDGYLQADKSGSITKGQPEKKWTVLNAEGNSKSILLLEDRLVSVVKDSSIQRDTNPFHPDGGQGITLWKMEPLDANLGLYQIRSFDKPDQYWEMDGENLKLSKLPDLQKYEGENPWNRKRFLFTFHATA
ncbi:hypothetical protein ASPCAL04077 [Aspergillus calidoustus]|uniref:Uncharacterized protein n=1 Tax=Aspergillus calidoustus TaxID=454130 RepID=A0A0U5GQ59_ASPCI|nr:hypothetical protein ASPCAL04077 [Aspergillus calidoustus]